MAFSRGLASLTLLASAAACTGQLGGAGAAQGGDGRDAPSGDVDLSAGVGDVRQNEGNGLGGEGSLGGASGDPGNGNGSTTTGAAASPTGGSGALTSECAANGALGIARESLRINDRQFERALRALFPFDITIEPQLDSTVTGGNLYSTFPGANEILANHANDLVAISEELAMQAVDNIGQLLPCDPSDGGEAACAAQFVSEFGARAFRRPLTAAEIDPLLALYDAVRSGSDPLDFELSIGALVQAILLAPDTLYLLERGEDDASAGGLVLTHYEIASRLSFLFWNEPPDAALMARAEAGELRDPEVLASEAARLLDDPRSNDTAQHFTGEWFGVADEIFVDHAPRELAEAWEEEVRRYVAHVTSEGEAISALLSGTQTFVNAPLADHYGIAPNPSSGPDDWQLVTLPRERRGGLLTMAQFAAATSLNNSTSVIHRGKIVREKLLCDQLGTPDPNFLITDLMVPDDASVRDRMNARLNTQPCGACHQFMDEIGIGMEDMDENGVFRTEYDDGRPVDAQGHILASTVEAGFNGTLALAERLADSDAFAECASEQWLHYSLGRSNLGQNEACLVERVRLASGGTIRDLLLAVATSNAFVHRLTEESQ